MASYNGPLRLPAPSAPRSSYWVGATRAQLAHAIAERRPQMSGPSADTWDSGAEAEISLRRRLAECKLRAALRRADAERLRRLR